MMIRRALTISIALGLNSLCLAAPIAPGAAVDVPPEAFHIMTKQEIAQHKAKMAKLAGTAREEYRNAQYALLKKRAMAQGYQLPDVPPWGRTDVLPAASPQNTANAPAPAEHPPKVADLPKLIEAQKKVVEAAIVAAADEASKVAAAPQPLPEAPATTPIPPRPPVAPSPTAPNAGTPETETAATATPPPATGLAFQQHMRERFERFRAERAARNAQLAQARARRMQQLQQQRRAFSQRQPRPPMVPPPVYAQPAYPYPPANMRPMPVPNMPVPTMPSQRMPYPAQPYHPGYPPGYPTR